MKIDDIYEVLIDNVDFNGNGVCKINNIVTFVSGALKEEKTKIKITSINKRYALGEIINIINPSKNRINVKCKYYSSCGGCCFLHTNYQNEIETKANEIERIFNIKPIILENKNIYNYRNKVTLHVLNGKLGYFNDKSHDLCEIEACALLDNKINDTIKKLNKYNLNGINEIMIRCINNKIMINIIGYKIDNSLYDFKCDSLYINDKYIKYEEYLVDEVMNLKYAIYPKSFYQVNKEGMKNIYNKAIEYAGNGNTLLDLYCGIGSIGLRAHNNFKSITGIEINEDAIKCANINKKLNNINNINFILDTTSNVKKYIKDYDVIIVDPPRSGLTSKVCNILNTSNTNKIVYISCNYKTLKKDVEMLDNYSIESLSICSMFPRTAHVECVSVLHRKAIEK